MSTLLVVQHARTHKLAPVHPFALGSRIIPTSVSQSYFRILSAGPITTKVKGEFALDHEDVAIRGMMVVEKGEMMWP